VLFLLDGERIVVIGSNAGNLRAPAWSHNLKANPPRRGADSWRAPQRARAGLRRRRARRAVAKMNAQYAGFDDYDERTSREIAVFVLEPRPAA